MSNQSSCRILKFLGMDVKCDKSPSVPEKSSSTDESKLGGVQSQEELELEEREREEREWGWGLHLNKLNNNVKNHIII